MNDLKFVMRNFFRLLTIIATVMVIFVIEATIFDKLQKRDGGKQAKNE